MHGEVVVSKFATTTQHGAIEENINRDFLTSEEKIEFFCNEAAKIQNVHLLENRVADGIAGCMGMCDFEYKHVPGATATQNKMLWKFCWFDGRHWNYKGN